MLFLFAAFGRKMPQGWFVQAAYGIIAPCYTRPAGTKEGCVVRHTMRHVSLFICILLMAGAAVLIGSRGQSPSNQELGELQVTCF